jgi:hypothetical protein
MELRGYEDYEIIAIYGNIFHIFIAFLGHNHSYEVG